MSARATFIPAWRKVRPSANPMPLAPPVMKATLSLGLSTAARLRLFGSSLSGGGSFRTAEGMKVKADRRIWEIWLSQYWFSCLRVAHETGILRLLQKTPCTMEALAEGLNLNLRATRAVVGMLEALQLVARDQRVLALTQDSQRFLVEGPYDWWPALNLGPHSPREEALLAALREGTESATGVPDDEGIPQPGEGHLPVVSWARGEVEPERARSIASVMHAHSLPSAEEFARAVSPGHGQRLLDVGGGSGCYSIALAEGHPGLRCTVLELEAMGRVAQGYIERAGLQERVNVHSANMFNDPWPEADIVLFSNVLHDWRPQTGLLLLKRAWQALPSGGEVWIQEMLMGPGAVCAAAFSVMMLLGTQGQQFHFEELKLLLEEANFDTVEQIPTAGYYSLVRARKA